MQMTTHKSGSPDRSFKCSTCKNEIVVSFGVNPEYDKSTRIRKLNEANNEKDVENEKQ